MCKTVQLTAARGHLAGARVVRDGYQVMLISTGGTVIKMPVEDVKRLGRSTQGVIVMRLREGELVSSLAPVVESGDDEPAPTTVAGCSNGDLTPDSPAASLLQDVVVEVATEGRGPRGQRKPARMAYSKQVDLLEPIDMAEHLDKLELYLGQVCAVAGISKMQLDYWTNKAQIPTKGKKQRIYDMDAVETVMLIKQAKDKA